MAFYWSCDRINIYSNFWIIDIYDRYIGIIPRFLYPRSRELESGNPPQHISIATVQGHELLKAIQEDIRDALDNQRAQIILEILDIIDLILQFLPDEESFIDSYFSF